MLPRHHLVRVVAGLLTAGALIAASVATADAKTGFGIGSGVSTKRVQWPRKPSPTPTTPTPTPTSPAPTSPTPTPTPSPTDTTPVPTSPTPVPTDSDCGGATLRKPNGTAWVCSFDDEFDGTSLDRSKWLVQTTEATGFRSGSGIECFVDSPNNITVSNGALHLTVRKESAPFTCKTPSTSYSSQYTSGMVDGYGRFTQTYGRFEVRAKLPNTTLPGLQETFWLWPSNPTEYGLWPNSGEIDFAEFYSRYNGSNIPYLHYDLQQSTVNWTTNTNVYTALPAPYNQPGMTCTYNTTAFNTYTVLWAPGQIILQVNGQNCVIDNYSATNVTGAAPFDQPFFIALTQALGVGANAFDAGKTPLPATTDVDYVRIWK
jgi:beta-glucanase (GH16 family)